ncbi:MAG TPA: acyl-CoA dehydrogenase family protein [Actinomycetota bacterium]|nr:acyl-CoA dehydrogenase family protein [Actinomycetota bacterium]
MDPRDTAEEARFRAEVRAWVQGAVPRFRDAYAATRDSEQRLRISADWQAELFEAGFGAIGWPAEYGGREGTPVQRFIVAQELGAAGAPWHLNMSVTLGWCAPAVLDYGTPAQKEKHLRRMLSGQEVWCQLFSEPNAGSDLASITTTAVRSDDEYVVNGQKIWSSGAHWSSFGILVVRTDPSAPRYKNLSFFICDMSNAGVEIRPITQITGERDFCEVFFSDARLAESDRVAEEGMGWTVTVHTLLNERIGLSGGGGMHRLVSQAWEGYLRSVKQTGPDGRAPLDDPRVRQRLADVYVRSVANRWTAMRALDAVFKGQMPGPEASVLKLTSDAWFQQVQEAAGEVLGPAALVTDGPGARDGGAWARGLLQSRAMTIGGGTTEVQKNIVGERVLGLPRDPRPAVP